MKCIRSDALNEYHFHGYSIACIGIYVHIPYAII